MKSISISAKLWLLAGLIALSAILCIGVAVQQIHQLLIDLHVEKVRAVVETTRSQAKALDERAKAGEFSQEEAKKLFNDAVRSMWYQDNEEYVFTIGYDGINWAHPARPQLEGTDMSGLKDRDGVMLVVELIKAAKAGGGSVYYHWPKAGSNEPIGKYSYAMGYEPWQVMIGTGFYTDELWADFLDNAVKFSLVGLAIALVGLLCAALMNRSIQKPLGTLRQRMVRLSEGEYEIEIPEAARGDEIGAMAKTVEVFKENGRQRALLEAQQEQMKREAEVERRKDMIKMANSFEQSVRGLVAQVAGAAQQMTVTAGAMSDNARDASGKAMTVSAASEQASTNVQTVATAAEELSSSIGEISRQVAQAAGVAGKAVEDAARTNEVVRGLAEAADKIEEVVRLINEIAEQTNLLALNATIEAARAGEAGKGFAVVASEVKNLANQTGKATEDIARQIAAIQDATRQSVSAIEGIGNTIREINQISTTIASAVEEQGAATQEIARNVQQASVGTQQVNQNIAGVSEAVSVTGQLSGEVVDTSELLKQQADRLNGEVDGFLASIRAA
ncbi:methyl-accepting chemotaxis protein [Oceanibaculum pacificum]|uniref:Chemotaxis protein n=1 Tax=Oceanibaculum pacificum TaxID=580166 RepID=A0A154VHP9_9PROT|nr:cache domain-containing protein [Oceanibaculum pacificum]KZD00889.1 hypothetical protein AUP43_14240 [Oceanibaculum pacificum]